MAEKVKQYRLPDDPITIDEIKSFLWAAATHSVSYTHLDVYKRQSSRYKYRTDS